MAEKVQILVTIGADGKVRLKTEGLKGDDCLEETKDLEAAVGKVAKREKTREGYEKAAGAKTKVKTS